MNPFGHMDLRVSNLEAALPFYEALLPALGFTERQHGEQWKVWATTSRFHRLRTDPSGNRLEVYVRPA